MATHTDNDATLMLRLPSELKAELMRAAAINKRKVTTEVIERLQNSRLVSVGYTASTAATLVHTKEKGPADTLSGTDQAMLEVFRRLPPEKQLALLSLFR
ncbi:MAG: hypothetical protein M9929_04015 [Burkholderiaceae bacterium]|nr:hypothetical protein [Burkholderiaceae bacterium]